jgi:uncharacterized protein YlxW (UPF0749 family)
MAVKMYKRRGELREVSESHLISLDVEIAQREKELNKLNKEREDLQKTLQEIEQS